MAWFKEDKPKDPDNEKKPKAPFGEKSPEITPPEKPESNGDEPEHPEGEYGNEPVLMNPFLLLGIALVVCFLPTILLSGANLLMPKAQTQSQQQAAEPSEPIIRVNEPREVGTYAMTDHFDVTSRGETIWHIYYIDPDAAPEDQKKSIEIAANDITFAPDGTDNTVTIYETTYDEMDSEGEDAKVIKENAKDPKNTAVIHYDPNKRDVEVYAFVSLEKNANKNANLTYSEAAGVTETISIPTSSVTVIDDHLGTVEKISEYDDHGQWHTRWIVHSLH